MTSSDSKLLLSKHVHSRIFFVTLYFKTCRLASKDFEAHSLNTKKIIKFAMLQCNEQFFPKTLLNEKA